MDPNTLVILVVLMVAILVAGAMALSTKSSGYVPPQPKPPEVPLLPVPVVRYVDEIEQQIAAEGRLRRSEAAWLIARIRHLEGALRTSKRPHSWDCSVQDIGLCNNYDCGAWKYNRTIQEALQEAPRPATLLPPTEVSSSPAISSVNKSC